MRKLVYLVASTLDGQIARADGSFDCFLPEGDHVADYLEMLGGFDDVLMGRATYEVGLRMGVTNPYPAMRGHVFSTTMRESPAPNVALVRDDPASYVSRLKAQPGRPVYLCGGSRLAAHLLRAGLIDEVVVKLNPLLIGDGIPLFAEIPEPVHLEYLSSKTYASGVLLLSYQIKLPAQ